MTAVEEMLAKKIWAVVGASADTEKYGYKVFLCLKSHGYTAYPVNPRLKELDGDKVYATLAGLPVRPDVVDCVVPPLVTLDIIRQCGELGIRYMWMQPGADSKEAYDLAKEYHIHAERACVLAALRDA